VAGSGPVDMEAAAVSNGGNHCELLCIGDCSRRIYNSNSNIDTSYLVKCDRANLANMASECGNLTFISPVPNSNSVIAGRCFERACGQILVGRHGLSWGLVAGSAVITNRPSWISYDPANPAIFYESGSYNGGGVYKTIDGGIDVPAIGVTNVNHIDFVSVDYTDPNRQTMLAGGHEQGNEQFWKSTDGGQKLDKTLVFKSSCWYRIFD